MPSELTNESPPHGRHLRVGVAGLGRIGAFHAESLFGHVPFARLAAVADTAEERAKDVGERFGIGWSTDPAQLVENPDLDAIVIATPTPTHLDLVLSAAAAGKAIFCEKPLGLDEDETRRVIETVEQEGVPLQIGLHRRFDPDVQEAKRLIQSGELGNIYSFRTSLRDMYPQPMEYIKESGNFFVDVTIHDLDLARWLVGEIEEVTVFGSSVSDPRYADLGTVDHAVVVVRFENGAMGTIDNSRIAGYGYEASTEVVGSKAAVRLADSQRTRVTLLTDAQSRQDHVTDFVERFAAAYRAELVAFVSDVSTGRPVVVNGWDALAALVLAQACDRSHATNEPVSLEVDHAVDGIRYQIADAGGRDVDGQGRKSS